jgi:hypothetical protein
MSDEHHRRASDDLILQMHGMLCTLTARTQDHMAWEEKEHERINKKMEDIEARMKPLEETRADLKKVWVAFWALLAATIFAAGTTFWYWLRNLLWPHAPVQ